MRIQTWQIQATYTGAPTLSVGQTAVHYDRFARPLPDLIYLTSCWPDELARLADEWADRVRQQAPRPRDDVQPALPFTYRRGTR